MEREDPLAQLKDHVVICNCNDKVKRIVEELQAPTVSSPPDVVLMHDEAAERLWRRHPEWQPVVDVSRARFLCVSGRPTSDADLRTVRIAEARAAVILADPALGELADARSTLVAIAIERENPQVHTVMELIASVNRVHLEATEINEVVCRGEITEKVIAQSCITPGIKNIFSHLLTTKAGTEQLFISHLPVALQGATYRELARRAIEGGAPFTLVGYRRLAEHEGRPMHQLVLSPRSGSELGRDTKLGVEDELIAIADRAVDLARWLTAGEPL